MNDELALLEAELEKVAACGLEYLPEYGFSSKEEVMQLIQEDIDQIRDEISFGQCDPEESLEDERMRLCILQGIPRYC